MSSAVDQSQAIRYSTGDLAERLGGQLDGETAIWIDGLNTIDFAQASQMTFVGDTRYAAAWAASKSLAVVVSKNIKLPERDDAVAIIRVPNADLAMITLLDLFSLPPATVESGIHDSAIVDPTASIGVGVSIGPGCVIGAHCVLGDGVRLWNCVWLDEHVAIGNGSELLPGVVVKQQCIIGAGTVLHSNVVIGTDGFGFRPSADGAVLLKVPHLGNVEIGDDVEIGACCCIDRGKFGATRIGSGSKLDNLCLVGHNCVIGRNCLICGQVAIGGTSRVGDGTRIGGAVCVADHVAIGAGVSIGGGSAVMCDVPDNEVWLGIPANERSLALRELAAMRKLPKWSKHLRKMFSPSNPNTDSGISD